MMINVNHPKYYRGDKDFERTRARLQEISDLGMKEVGIGEFGYPGVMSGLYLEYVWTYSDEDFKDYMFWAKSRITDNINPIRVVLAEIIDERIRQNNKWGEQNHSLPEWIAILTEEVGEAAKEAVKYHHKETVEGARPTEGIQKERLENFRKEMVQVAAVAVQIIEFLDRNKND